LKLPNIDRPGGLTPVQNVHGGPWNGATNMYLVDSGDGTATFIGDLVKLAGSSGTAGQFVNGIDVEGMPTIAQSAAGDTHVGVVVGFLPSFDSLTTRHRVASTSRIALVADDPDTVFEIQEVSGGTALTAAAVGLNANVVVGSGSATTGLSAAELNNATEATTADLDLKILRMAPKPDNAIGEHCKWLVLINTHSYAGRSELGTAGL
jgi:hypothetical protein